MIHLNLDVSPQLYDLLTDLADRANTSRANVLRQAVVLFEVALEAKEQGKRFGVVGEDGTLEKEVVGL